MATPKHIQPFIGSKELATLIEIINNKDAFTKALAEIETARESANAAFQDLSVGKTVESALQAGRDAQKKVDDAVAVASGIVEEAHKEKAWIEADAKAVKDKAEEAEVRAKVKSDATDKELKILESDLKAKEAKLSLAEADLVAREKDVKQAQATFEERENRVAEGEQKIAAAMAALK